MSWNAAVAAVGVGQTAALLGRMRREFDSAGRLCAATAGWMYATYLAHGAATAVAVVRAGGGAGQSGPGGPAGRRKAAARGAGGVGVGLGLAGAGLGLAGMGRFAGPAQVSGTDPAGLVRGGVYRYSRNPQYTGYVAVLVGLGLAARAPVALGLAGVAAVVFRWWVPVEEAHLERTFGESYRSWRTHTPRWFGRPRPAADTARREQRH